MAEQRYILLDQGAFRGARLRERIANNANACFVIPDVAFSEMAIKADPIQSTTQSLKALRPVVDRTFGRCHVIERRSNDRVLFEIRQRRLSWLSNAPERAADEGRWREHCVWTGAARRDFGRRRKRI